MSTVFNDFEIQKALTTLHVEPLNEGTSTGQHSFSNGVIIESYSPVDGQLIGKVKTTTEADYKQVKQAAIRAFKIWRTMPAPHRGEIVRQF